MEASKSKHIAMMRFIVDSLSADGKQPAGSSESMRCTIRIDCRSLPTVQRCAWTIRRISWARTTFAACSVIAFGH